MSASFCVGICLISLVYIAKRGITGSYVNSLFNILRNCQTVFHNDHIIPHCKFQCMRVPVFFYFLTPLLLLSVFWIIAIHLVVKWYLIVLILISLMTNDVERLFMCLLAICKSSLEKYLLRFLTNFFKLGCPFYY